MKDFKRFMIEAEVSGMKISHSLLIRLFEYFREEEMEDDQLHEIAERMNFLSASGKILTMKNYNFIIYGE
jgi:hypothetical protein